MFKIPPAPRYGIHRWLPSAARAIRSQQGSPEECLARLYAEEPNLRRRFQPNEVENAVSLVYQTELPDSPAYRRANAPNRKPARIKWSPAITGAVANRIGLTHAALLGLSPTPVDSQIEILRALFPDPDGLLCIGQSAREFRTGKLSEFTDLSTASLIVPAYMTGTLGRRKTDGGLSAHTLDNTGPRRFCVVDFDEPPPGEHVSLAWHIGEAFNLVLVVSTGGKGLHAWYSVPTEREDSFWPFAIRRGADVAIFRNLSSFVRMPGGTRENGKRQSILYFDRSNLPS